MHFDPWTLIFKHPSIVTIACAYFLASGLDFPIALRSSVHKISSLLAVGVSFKLLIDSLRIDVVVPRLLVLHFFIREDE